MGITIPRPPPMGGEVTNNVIHSICDIWCIYRFGGLIDGCSALGVVYEVSLEVVRTTRA